MIILGKTHPHFYFNLGTTLRYSPPTPTQDKTVAYTVA
jgi:hypothetical protein